jgi:NADPH-dependent glutamate synthase beta subunit-like oxidoreductase/Pyruvate/2-oxoacid:ferredoxin oxidoreductase delta subunit
MSDLTHVDGYPEIPVSLLASRGVLRTGEWRNMRPVPQERRAPCSDACPAAVPVPRYLHYLGEGELREAYETFTLRNPFPSITGRVCPHFCESACNRDPYDGPLSIRALERYLGDAAAGLPLRGPQAETGRRVAVIGSGPGGLSAAYYLRRSGHRVVVYEKRERPGGLLRYGIPEYRLPEAVVEAEVARLQALGIEFRLGAALGEQVSLEGLKQDHDAVVVATGAWEGRELGVAGESLFEAGLEYLEQVARGRLALPGRRCAVIGGGNTAMDVARVLRRLGGEVTVLYRRTAAEMPAIAEESAAAAGDGVRFEFLTLPRAAAKEGGALRLTVERMRLGAPDASGRARPEPTGEMLGLVFDAVFKAVGERADLTPFPDSMRQAQGGWLEVGPDGSTTDESVFVAGDLATGPATVVEAIGRGRRAAEAVNARIGGGYEIPSWVLEGSAEVVGSGEVNRAYFSRQARVEVPNARAERGPGGALVEETATILGAAALTEIERCYSCGYCNHCGTCFVFCPDAAIGWDEGPVLDLEFCKGCGICSVECPGHVLLFVRENGDE